MNRGGTQEIIINHDGTTGVFRTESNTPLAIGTNGSEQMRITSAGEVLIGTTTDSGNYKLQVNGRGLFQERLVVNQTANDTQLQILGNGTNIMSLQGRDSAGSGASLIALNNDGGNVSIGTTAQLARTTILSDSSAQTIGLIGRSADNIATIRWWNNAGNTIYTAIESNANYTIYNTVTNGYAAFFTNNSERLRITSAGNVGIGTTSPDFKLHLVGGSQYINGGQGGVVNSSPYTSANRLIFNNDYNDVARGPNKITLYDGTWLGGFGVHDNTLAYYSGGIHNWYQATTATNAVSLMTLTSSGSLGIGTTSPGSKLNIVGGFIRVQGTEVDQFFLEGIRTGTSTTVRIYDNSSVVFYDSYSSMIFRANQNGGSGGYIGLFGGNVGVNEGAPSQRLHVNGNIRVTGAYYDSNNEAGTSGQVLSSTGSGTDWVTPATTTASSLYDLLPAARTTYDWTVQMTSGAWADIFSSNTVLSNGTWMVQVYVDDYASGGQQYQETYSGVMSWGNAASTNQGGVSAISEVVLHRSGHAANAGQFYLRTQERATSTLLLQGMINYSHTSNTTINFKFVKVF
jgi:hypothetical protein